MIFCLGDDLLQRFANTNIPLEHDSYLAHLLIKLIESENNCLLPESEFVAKVYSKVMDNPNVSIDMKRVVNYCYKQFVSTFHIVFKVRKIIIISDKSSSEDDGHIRLSVEYLIANNLRLDNPVALLSEDLLDCKFYHELAQKIIGNNELNIKLRYLSGAGKNIAKKLNISIMHNRDFVYAICDSDKFHPDDEVGDTARYLTDEANELINNEYIHFDYEILEVSEKENLVKPSEYDKFLEQRQLLIPYIEAEKNSQFSSHLYYLDYKCGLKKTVYLRHKAYYDDFLRNQGKIIEDIDLEKLKDNDAIFLGLGRTCMSKYTVNHLNIAETDLDRYRYRISENIFSWGVSIPEQKII